MENNNSVTKTKQFPWPYLPLGVGVFYMVLTIPSLLLTLFVPSLRSGMAIPANSGILLQLSTLLKNLSGFILFGLGLLLFWTGYSMIKKWALTKIIGTITVTGLGVWTPIYAMNQLQYSRGLMQNTTQGLSHVPENIDKLEKILTSVFIPIIHFINISTLIVPAIAIIIGIKLQGKNYDEEKKEEE